MGRDKARDYPVAAGIQALLCLQSSWRIAHRNRKQPAILSDHQVTLHRLALARRHGQNECVLNYQLGRRGACPNNRFTLPNAAKEQNIPSLKARLQNSGVMRHY